MTQLAEDLTDTLALEQSSEAHAEATIQAGRLRSLMSQLHSRLNKTPAMSTRQARMHTVHKMNDPVPSCESNSSVRAVPVPDEPVKKKRGRKPKKRRGPLRHPNGVSVNLKNQQANTKTRPSDVDDKVATNEQHITTEKNMIDLKSLEVSLTKLSPEQERLLAVPPNKTEESLENILHTDKRQQKQLLNEKQPISRLKEVKVTYTKEPLAEEQVNYSQEMHGIKPTKKRRRTNRASVLEGLHIMTNAEKEVSFRLS